MTNLYLIIMAIFATVIVGIYAIIPKKFRYIVLLVASVSAIFVCSKFMGFFIIFTALSVYLCGFGIGKLEQKYAPLLKELEKQERKKKRKLLQKKKYLIMFIAILVNLAILFLLKYLNFFGDTYNSILTHFGKQGTFSAIHLLLPLGISYYTLQALGYIIDVAQGKYPAENNIFKLMLFICFFPQLYEGPIGRYNEMREELFEGNKIVKANILHGLLKCIWGLFKILIVSNRLGMITGEIFKNYANYGGFTIILAAIAFTIQLYAEFSGFIDISSGVSRMFGIGLKKNFDTPFLAQNIPDFWRRWHISLGSWFRDYLFYPIAASSFSLKIQEKDTKFSRFIGKVMNIFTLLIIWFLTGLWHGASLLYVLYGLYYFALMAMYEIFNPLLSKLWKKMKIDTSLFLKIVRVIITSSLVAIGMLLFRASSPSAFAKMFVSIFSGGKNIALFSFIDVKDFIVLLVGIAVIICSGVLTAKKISVSDTIIAMPYAAKCVIFIAAIIVIIIFGAYGNGYIPPDPIYGGF